MSGDLTPSQLAAVKKLLRRPPSAAEAGIFSAMWSEHCSYGSSKKWLKKLPAAGVCVVTGEGENAGAVSIGGGEAAVFKMESHNHPSFIEPFQGAATGVGGIMRDIFTMGARPVAFLNSLRFGDTAHTKTRHLLSGVVSGISAYGNCVGVPTVGGEVDFDSSFNDNILVNVMCVGVAREAELFYSAMKPGALVVYVGARTGRDGIKGAVMASAGFAGEAAAQRPAVQIGDPFMQKLLLESTLELMRRRAILAAQDMGAAGLTSSSVEMAGKGGAGVRLELDKIPCREENMTAREIMLSESQERMLFAVERGREKEVAAVCQKWGLESVVIGEAVADGFLTLTHKGKQQAHIPLSALLEGQPELARPYTLPRPPRRAKTSLPAPSQPLDAVLLQMLAGAELGSRRWVWQQYDHMVMGDTLQNPGGDAAVIRVHGSRKALALTSEATPAYCRADAGAGARQAVAEARRNLIACGAAPLAITNCLNFGNPEDKQVMGQFVAAVEGLAEAADAFMMPVISGNVSFYNETAAGGVSKAITPIPCIGAAGVLADYAAMATPAFKDEGELVLLVGETAGHWECSAYAAMIAGREGRCPPPVDFAAEQHNGDFVREAILRREASAAHDIARGGLLVALAEMALAGNIGAKLVLPSSLPAHIFLFSEDQARYVITCKRQRVAGLKKRAKAAGVMLTQLGQTGGNNLTLPDTKAVSLRSLRAAHESFLPAYMAGEK